MTAPFIERLHQCLSTDPFRKKILIASNHAQGLQWLEQVTSTFGGVEHTQAGTLESILLGRSKWMVYASGSRYINDRQAFWLIHQIMHEMAEQPNPFISSNLLSFGLVRRFADCIRDLREAGVRADDLKMEGLESVKKGSCIRQLLSQYEERLEKERLADFTALVSLVCRLAGASESIAAESASDDVPCDVSGGNSSETLYLMQDHHLLSRVRRRALKWIAGDSLLCLTDDPEFTDPSSGFPYADCDFFHATGTLAEIREIFRRMADRKIGFDQTEIILSDSARYMDAVYHLANQLEIPCSYAEGLPAGVTRTGKAAQAYIRWIESNFHTDSLLHALRHGWIQIPMSAGADHENDQPSSAFLAAELEKSGVGWGRSRYARLARKAEAEADPLRKRALQTLADFFDSLLQPYANGMEMNPRQIWSGMLDFLERSVQPSGERERAVFKACRDILENMAYGASQPMPAEQAYAYVQKLLEDIRCEISPMPEPGKVFVSSLRSGGLSGRPYPFIAGMDERNWQVKASQDPVLSDTERKRISDELFTSQEQAAHTIRERACRMSKLTGKVTMSFCSYHVAGNEERNPAFEMLHVFRNGKGGPQAEPGELLRAAGKAVHYAGEGRSPLDQTDAWLAKLADSDDMIRAGKEAVYRAYPFQYEGEKASAARRELPLTEYDGFIDTSRFPIRYGKPNEKALSASRMETYAGCPLYFYFQAVLGIYPKEQPEFDHARWLDPLQRGRLLHRIYERYMRERQESGDGEKGAKPDRTRLSAITEQALQEAAKEIPAPSDAAKNKEAGQIRQDIEVFYNLEAQRSSLPRYFELELHNEQQDFQLEMGEDLTLPLKGIVDRVDEISPHQYRILDYKTGSNYKYRQNEYFGGGTQLQHALYAWAAEQWLRQTGVDPKACVSEAAYVFPTVKGMGVEVSLLQNKRGDLKDLLRHMLSAMEQGVFPPTADPGNCRWCDYQSVCGNHAQAMKEKRDAMENTERLAHLLEVNRYA